MFLKNYLRDKAVGFWLSVGIAALSLVVGVVYQVTYGGSDSYSATVFVAPLCVFVLTAVLCGVGMYGIASAVQLVGSAVGLGCFLYSNYYYISVVFVGIDVTEFSARFLLAVVGFAVLTIVSAVNMFLKQTKSVAVSGEEVAQ